MERNDREFGARPLVRAAAKALAASIMILAPAACSGPEGLSHEGAASAELPTFDAEPLLMEPAVMVAGPSSTMAADAPPAVGASPHGGRSLGQGRAPGAKAGVVTAGDIDDALNWNAFTRTSKAARRALGLPQVVMGRPVAARLTGPDGGPAPGVPITLRKPGAAAPFYSGVSGVDGRIFVFPALHGGGRGAVEVRAFDPHSDLKVTAELAPGRFSPVALPFDGKWTPEFLDLVLVLDTTGSMGDELAWLAAEIEEIVARAARTSGRLDVRFGLITYRDKGDVYVARRYGFTRSAAVMTGWLRAEEATGGGDRAEASHIALAAAAQMNWRRGRGERLLFHVADAPPHERRAAAQVTAIRALIEDQVQVFGVAASGAGADTEFMMRQAAVASGGRYLFLTDDSGIGAPHEEPSVPCYQATRLKDLFERVLVSELTGRRVEAHPSAVLRTVGVPQRGVCRA